MRATNTIMNDFLSRANARNDGANGGAYEFATRCYIMGREPKTMSVKAQGKTDITFTKNGKRYSCEIKTACGEVEMAERNQFVIYCPVVDPDFPAELQGYVFSREEWTTFLNGYTGRGKFLREDSKRGHIHIQSFFVSETVRPKASKPIAEYIWSVCNEMPTVEEFFER